MSDILRQLAIWICKPIYKCILGLYEIFYTLSTAQFLTSEEIEKFSANIYVLISVVMLFAFSATILSAIVNPDLLEDKKKGVGAVFKRAIIGLALIVVIPFAFSEAFKIQESIMTSHVVEKVIVGLNFDNPNDANTGGNGGQIIAGTLMASMLRPSSDSVEIEVYAGDNVADAYTTMISTDFSKGIDKVAKYINRAPKNGDEEYAFEFEGLLAIIAGLATAYILLLFAIDMAIRMFKIAFFELTAPISIVAYIAAGGDVLKNWFSEVLKTYLDVFIRVTAMAFYLFLVSKINDFISDASKIHTGSGWGWDVLLKVLLVVGMLIFVNRIPNLIKKLFPKADIGGKSSIGGRLGEMAIVGKQAQNAWDTIRKHPIQSAGRPIGAAAGVAGNLVHSTAGAYRRTMRSHNGNKALAIGAGIYGAARGLAGAPGALRRGWKTGNLTALGNEYARDREIHPEGLTTKGIIGDKITGAFGYGTKLDRLNDRIARENRFKYDDGNGLKAYTKDELNKIASQYDDVKKRTQGIQDVMKKEIERKDSKLKNHYQFQGIDLGELNDHEIKATLASLRTAAPKMEDFKIDNGSFTFEYKDINGNNQAIQLTGLTEQNLDAQIATLQSYAPKMSDFEIKDAAGNGTGQIDMNKFLESESKYNEVIKNFKDKTLKSIQNNEVRYDQKKFIQSFNEYNESITKLEDQVRKNYIASENTLHDDINAGRDWTRHNEKGDDSNRQAVKLDMDVLDGLLKNKGYATKLGYNPDDLKSRDGIENLNTMATDNVNDITKIIEEVEANRNARYTTEEYQQAARNDRNTDNKDKKEFKVHKTPPGANDDYR